MRGLSLSARDIEPEIVRGHRPLGKTGSRHAIFDPDYLAAVRDGIDGIDDIVSDLTSNAGQALHPSASDIAVPRV